ncbi:MAG: hypothetical protein CM15mL5_0380 [uncultured marine virus]|nr:MAG: hypothetical protein CM15mL5_0380 [uncultured marine virus]
MDPIEEIDIQQVIIPQLDGRSWMYQVPAVPNNDPPVTIQLGFPIVELPGCVEAHPDNKIGANNLPLDRNLVNDDPDGVRILCPNGEYPSYDALNYEPEQIIPTTPAPPPPVAPPAPEIPNTGDIVTKKETPCPGPGQLRVGDVTQSGDERVVGHRLLDDGKTCETLYEPTSVVEKYLPPINQASTVTALAVVATAGAAATPLLIRIIRPVVKKIWATIQKKLGKEVKRPSMAEVRTNKYREKKGLPPIKKK